MQQGMQQESHATAQRMLAKGFDIKLIAEITKLFEAEIKRLNKKT